MKLLQTSSIVSGDYTVLSIDISQSVPSYFPYGPNTTLSVLLAAENGSNKATFSSIRTDDKAFNVVIDSSNKPPVGNYSYQIVIENTSSGVRKCIETGTFSVKESLSTANSDTRTHAKKCLDNVTALIEGRAGVDVYEWANTAGINLKKESFDSLLKRQKYYASLVAKEKGLYTGFISVPLG